MNSLKRDRSTTGTRPNFSNGILYPSQTDKLEDLAREVIATSAKAEGRLAPPRLAEVRKLLRFRQAANNRVQFVLLFTNREQAFIVNASDRHTYQMTAPPQPTQVGATVGAILSRNDPDL